MPRHKTRSVSDESVESMNVTEDAHSHPPNAQRLERRKGLLDVSSTRRIRPQKGDSDSEPLTDSESEQAVSHASSSIVSEKGLNKQSSKRDSDEDGASEESDSDSSSQLPLDESASISFGALAAAQETLGKRKRPTNEDNSHSDIESSTTYPADPKLHKNGNSEALERKAGKKDTRDFSRPSKHAPTELSSKKAVSRKRSVVPTKKSEIRDPRFEPLTGPLDEQKLKKNYAFLDTYRDTEIAELKTTIRKTKDIEAKEKLKRAVLSLESKKKAQERKELEQEVVRKHRREEKEKIEKGKKPFYLKESERKKLALEERFKGLKGKQVDRVIERRRKKLAQREKRAMPDARRG